MISIQRVHVGGRAVSIQWVAVERTVVEPGKEAIFASLLAYVASKFTFWKQLLRL